MNSLSYDQEVTIHFMVGEPVVAQFRSTFDNHFTATINGSIVLVPFSNVKFVIGH